MYDDILGGPFKPWLNCVVCERSSDAMLKRTFDKFAVPLCYMHYGNTENVELTHDNIQGYYYIARDY